MAVKTETLSISGMSCNHCVRAVREALERVEGVEVESVEVGSARVRYDEAQVQRGDFESALSEEGYGVTG